MGLQPTHRARRFVRSLVPRRPSESDMEWVAGWLTAGELKLFARMPTVDRAHSIGVARRVEAHLGELGEDQRWVMAAALTHDVGKSVAGLGTYGRVVATLSEAVGGRSMARVWSDRSGMTRRVGLYLQYPRLGADLLAVAGSDERVVAWAAEHHEPEPSWTVPAAAGRVLVSADDAA